MTGALVILAALVVIGALLYITDKKYFRHHHGATDVHATEVNDTQEDICCGLHLVCEKTSLAVVSDEIVYYDDEELDRFKGREPDTYSSDEIEEFRDVLLTLLPDDVADWARSISVRGIQLPPLVKDELFLIISELRES